MFLKISELSLAKGSYKVIFYKLDTFNLINKFLFKDLVQSALLRGAASYTCL